MEVQEVVLQNDAERDGALEGGIEQFGQKEAIDVLIGLTPQIFVAVAASVINDDVITCAKVRNGTVQRMLYLSRGDIAQLQMVVRVRRASPGLYVRKADDLVPNEVLHISGSKHFMNSVWQKYHPFYDKIAVDLL